MNIFFRIGPGSSIMSLRKVNFTVKGEILLKTANEQKFKHNITLIFGQHDLQWKKLRK